MGLQTIINRWAKSWPDYERRIRITFDRMFTEREVMLRTDAQVWFFRISSRMQMAAAAVVMMFAGWASYASISLVVRDHIINAKDTELLNARASYRSLLNEVSDYQSKFSSLTKQLEENHNFMLNLVENNATLQTSLKSTKNRLKDSEVEAKRVAEMREALKGRLNEIERQMTDLSNRNFELKGNLSIAASDLEKAMAERDAAISEKKQFAGLIEDLEQQIVNLHESEKDVVARLTKQTAESIADMQNVFTLAGLDLNSLLGKRGGKSGQGGPFVPALDESDIKPGEHFKASLDLLDSHVSHHEELQTLMRQLPLSPPMDFFTVSSHYGKRRDPINKQWAMHYGLDLGGPMRSSVFATAPGRVTYAGRKGKYGRFIEIDHGNGIKTRYGHLNKILVKRGQKVGYHDKIGLLGNSGRSTGPHLHYEVHVNGRPKNPWKFIKAGRYVYKG